MTHDRLVFIIRLTPYRQKPARTTAVTCEVNNAEVDEMVAKKWQLCGLAENGDENRQNLFIRFRGISSETCGIGCSSR